MSSVPFLVFEELDRALLTSYTQAMVEIRCQTTRPAPDFHLTLLGSWGTEMDA